jgi:protein-S-isoprenylcysteine O-methyltransferase Ste14
MKDRVATAAILLKKRSVALFAALISAVAFVLLVAGFVLCLVKAPDVITLKYLLFTAATAGIALLFAWGTVLYWKTFRYLSKNVS